jgi:hypothetical protein
MSHRQITVPVYGWAVLRLRPIGDARGGPRRPKTGGVLSLQWAFIWHYNSWGWIWGKKICRQGKIAAGTKLSSIGSVVLGSARASSAATSASSISFKISDCNVPTSRIALIEAQDTHCAII